MMHPDEELACSRQIVPVYEAFGGYLLVRRDQLGIHPLSEVRLYYPPSPGSPASFSTCRRYIAFPKVPAASQARLAKCDIPGGQRPTRVYPNSASVAATAFE